MEIWMLWLGCMEHIDGCRRHERHTPDQCLFIEIELGVMVPIVEMA
jgi:hypothetical protein